jgi:Transglutaminase elicitor
MVPDQPPEASGDADPTPWSGWWWPANGAGPSLFAAGGPLDKYDRYVAAETGSDPGTRVWERQNVYLPGIAWAGHCNGLAAAALLEPEPTAPIDVDGIGFSVADLKALLVDYDFGVASAWSYGDAEDLSPADFQRVLLEWLANKHSGFVLTFDRGNGEVWSFPVYRFTTEWAPDPVQDELWHVTTTVWMADINVPPGFVGTRWYPDSARRNETRVVVSPGLDRAMIDNILAAGEATLRIPD